MAARQIFRILMEKGKWLVTKDGELMGIYKYKKAAENLARKKAALSWSSQVLIYRPNGSIEASLFMTN